MFYNHSDAVQSVFFDADGDADMDLYVVSGGNEINDATQLQDRLYINNGKGNFTVLDNALPEMNASKSCVVTGDFNNDGRPDLFVGGRVVPGKYGVAPQSYLLQNQTINGVVKFVDVTANIAPSLQHVGMVTAAVLTDLNNDHLPDLMVAGEWMPVKVFVNQKNSFADKTNDYGLQNSNGLWTCIAPMDIDNDGDQDFLLGNLAPNTAFSASVKEPMTLCVNDFFHVGKTEPILCYYIQGQSYPYASRNEILEDMPALKNKFLYYSDYAKAHFTDVFSAEQRKGMTELKVNELKNCWLENKGNGQLILRQLPMAAQVSAIQGAAVTAVKSDGSKVIFAAGNFYPFRVQLGREDAGKGILLQWNNSTHQLVQSSLSMGIVADGDVRDVVQVKTAMQENLIVISKNGAPVQVIKQKDNTQ